MLHRKGAKTTQFDTIAFSQRLCDLAKDCVDNILHIPLVEMRVLSGYAMHKFGFIHVWHSGAILSSNRPYLIAMYET